LKPSTQAKLGYAQRISAMVLALCVIVHLVTILYAIRSGLSASAILGRTQGNLLFAAFYVLFVAAVVVHAPIGFARIAEEWLNWRGRTLEIAMLALAGLLAVLGLRAVWGVYGG
jgi:fumarate reductase subunit C